MITNSSLDFQDLSILDLFQFYSLYGDPVYTENMTFFQKVMFRIKIFFMFFCMYFFLFTI